MQLNQLTFEKASLLQMVGLLTGAAVAAAVWECVCVCVLPGNLIHWQWISPPTLHPRGPWLLSVSIQQRWMQPGLNTWLESSCSLPLSKFLDAGNTHPRPYQMQSDDLQEMWKGVIAHRMINRNEPVFCWDWFVVCVCMYRHIELPTFVRNCSTNSYSGCSSVVTYTHWTGDYAVKILHQKHRNIWFSLLLFFFASTSLVCNFI